MASFAFSAVGLAAFAAASGLGRLVGLLDVEVGAHAQHHGEHDEDNQQDLQTLTFTGHEFRPPQNARRRVDRAAVGFAEGAGRSEKLGHGGTFPGRVQEQTASSRLSPPRWFRKTGG